MKTNNITIIGLNRLGRSVGLALKKTNLEVTIIGHDSDSRLMKEAQNSGAVDQTKWHLVSAASAADILLIAVPANQLELTLKAIGDSLQEHAVIVDLSGLKGLGQKWADAYLTNGHYVGARPVLAANMLELAGEEAKGARADLFKNSLFCLVPGANVDPKAVDTAVQIGGLLGAKPFFLDMHEYDHLTQGVTVIPGLLAAALFGTVTEKKGWRDILRLADQPFAIGTANLRQAEELSTLVESNKEATLHWLDEIIGRLKSVRTQIADDQPELMVAWLNQLNLERDKWLESRLKNEWEEGVDMDPQVLSIGAQLFGAGWDRSKKGD